MVAQQYTIINNKQRHDCADVIALEMRRHFNHYSQEVHHTTAAVQFEGSDISLDTAHTYTMQYQRYLEDLKFELDTLIIDVLFARYIDQLKTDHAQQSICLIIIHTL